jgi:protein lifeguard
LVVLSSIYIIFDTRLIITKMSYDDYIIAALMLYIDIINLFMYILALFGSASS